MLLVRVSGCFNNFLRRTNLSEGNVMTDLNKMVDELSKLSVMEAAELSKLLQEKWGVSAAAPVAVAATGGAEEQKSAEKDTFDMVYQKLETKKLI